MNIYYARTSKLVSDFLSLERSLVTNSAHAAHVPARLQATWAELVRRGGLSDQKIKKGTFLRIEKLSFWESALKICDVAGTPTDY